MKILLLSVVALIGVLQPGHLFHNNINTAKVRQCTADVPDFVLQDSEGSGRMSSIVFKMQDYCRAELKDFEFDARFEVLGATVYFTGENFPTMKRGFIKSSSLKPIKDLMKQCQPGSFVTFDEIKVKGPDNLVRTLPGVSYFLY
ncbi:MAG: hypothetical protein EOP48_34150 [Sphingobacteriales bacterium]|nr:MAG: hypothetical protein EOP48_34150 [Sphingobacteriales bacterium]